MSLPNITLLPQHRMDGCIASLLALLGGSLLPFAFAPYGFYGLAIFCPALLLLTLWHQPSLAARLGWLFGVAYFAIGTYWIFISIHEYGHTDIFWASLLTAFFVISIALLPAIACYLLVTFIEQRHWALGFPCVWLSAEWCQSHIFTGFPWLLLGYSQVDSPLAGLIPVLGNAGMSAVLITIASFAVASYYHPYTRRWFWLILGLVALAAWLLHAKSWTVQTKSPLQVSLIQGNIQQQLKWSPDYLTHTLQHYAKLSTTESKQDLIVWPESALPIPYQMVPTFLQQLQTAALPATPEWLIGTLNHNDNSTGYYNSLLHLGSISTVYNKQKLVPFGETIPFGKWLEPVIGLFSIPMTDFVAGKPQQTFLTVRGQTIASFICYEIAYETLLKTALPQAKLLVTVTNDAWFDDSIARDQHLQIARFRALQSGRYLLFSSNNGLTAVIQPNGQIQSQLAPKITAVLRDKVYFMRGVTPWSQLARYFFYYIALGLLLGLLVCRCRKQYFLI